MATTKEQLLKDNNLKEIDEGVSDYEIEKTEPGQKVRPITGSPSSWIDFDNP